MTKESEVKEFEAGGIKVLWKAAVNDVISAKLFISGGVDNYGKDQEGIENFAFGVLADGGSLKYPREEYHATLERKGIHIGGSSNYDYSTISFKTIAKNWDLAWDIFQDVVIHPAWDEKSFSQLQNQTVSGLKQQQSDPDHVVKEMSMKGTFTGKRYEKDPDGTPETIESLTLEDLKTYYPAILKKEKLMLVVVGNVLEEDLRQKVEKAFAGMAEGNADVFASNPPEIASSSLEIQEREIATNYMRGIFTSPPEGTRESLAMRIAMSILSDRLFIEIRTKRNLSYAPAAYMASLFDPYCVLYVSTTNPNLAVQVMMDELSKIKTEGFKDSELRNKKETFLTGYYMGQETNSAQASTLGVFFMRGDWRKALTFKDDVYSLTTAEINDAIRKYAGKIKWYYLGDKKVVDESVFLGN